MSGENGGCLNCVHFSHDNKEPQCGKDRKDFMIQLAAGDTIECEDWVEKTS